MFSPSAVPTPTVNLHTIRRALEAIEFEPDDTPGVINAVNIVRIELARSPGEKESPDELEALRAAEAERCAAIADEEALQCPYGRCECGEIHPENIAFRIRVKPAG